jgi:hypothetical protein
MLERVDILGVSPLQHGEVIADDLEAIDAQLGTPVDHLFHRRQRVALGTRAKPMKGIR